MNPLNLPKRIVTAPPPIQGGSGTSPANAPLNVDVDWDEAVDWTWTTDPDGQDHVSGYTIRKLPPSKD